MWTTISSEHNDINRYELTKMDYIHRSNIIEMSGERMIVTELEVELPTYPRRGIKSKRSSIIIIYRKRRQVSLLGFVYYRFGIDIDYG